MYEVTTLSFTGCRITVEADSEGMMLDMVRVYMASPYIEKVEVSKA